jgi:curved DNA-binding protein CbpA
MGTYYEALGIPRDASPERIKHAHRSLVKVWHPDKFPGGSEREAEANRRIREINAAYTVLSNARSRASYDEKLEAASRRVPYTAYPTIPEHCSQCGKPTTYWDTAGGKTARLCYACGGVRI